MFRLGVTPYLAVSNIKDYYFWTGKTAISVTDGPGIINAYLKDGGFDWDFSLQPAGPAGPISNTASIAGPHIMTTTQNADLAWEWIKFFAMNREHLSQWVSATGRMPALLSALSDYPTAMNIKTKNFNAVLEQANYPAKKQFAVDTSLNPRLVSLTNVWKGTTPSLNFLQAQHEKTTAIIEELKAKNAGGAK
jgi:maltose-binding protein MalE